MNLTPSQIDELFLFTEKKFVKFYDLQTELVDHLASKIEEETDHDKSLSFETALQKVYSEFGIFGFAKIVQKKETELKSESRRMLRQEFLHQFTFPNLIRSLAIGAVLFTALQLLSIQFIISAVGIGVLIGIIVLFKRNYRNALKKNY